MNDATDDGPRLAAMYQLLGMLPAPTQVEMVRMYCDALVSQVELLGQSLAQAQAQDSAPIAHKIAGSAAMMQDQELSQSARAMERALLAGHIDEAAGLWPLVQACAEFTLRSLRRRYHGSSPA